MINHCQLCAVFWEIALVLVSHSPLFFFSLSIFSEASGLLASAPLHLYCMCVFEYFWMNGRTTVHVRVS